MGTIKPLQKLPLAKKLELVNGASVPAWIKENALYWVQYNGFLSTEHLRIQADFDIAKGLINPDDYEYVTNPYAVQGDAKKDYPAKLRNYDIIKPVIDRLLGERKERPNKISVAVNNSDVLSLQKDYHDNLVKKHLTELYLSELKKYGFDVQAQQQVDKSELEKELETPYLDKRAIRGQTALEYIDSTQDLESKFQRLYYNFLICGWSFSFKDINHKDVTFEVIHPQQISVAGWDTSSQFAEDAEAIVARYYWNMSTIIDKFREYLSDEQIDYLTLNKELGLGNSPFYELRGGNTVSLNASGLITVEHIVWKSFSKRGILTYIDETGQPNETEVDEFYKIETDKGDLDVQWVWENEWWEIWRVGNSLMVDEKCYIKYGVGQVQRTQINNTSICKLPYNGAYWGYTKDAIEGIVSKGLSYQLLYNIFHYRFELTLAKNKDKLLLFPLGLIPTDKGWDTDKWFYSISAFSIAFFDESSDKALAAYNSIKEIDLSLGQYMKEMWSFMKEIKDEFWDVVGMNRQRYGEVQASDRKSVTEQAVFRSAIANREMIAMFERYREVELDGLLDYSKMAWIGGKQEMFTTSTGDRSMLDIDGATHMDCQFSVHVSNGVDEQAKINTLKELFQPMLQNGVPASTIAEIVDCTNVSKIKQLIREGEKIQQSVQQDAAKSQQTHEQTLQNFAMEREKMKTDAMIKVAQISADGKTEQSLILADSFNAAGGDADHDGIGDSEEIIQRHYDRALEAAKLSETMRKNQVSETEKQQKLGLEQQKINIQKSQINNK